MGDKVTCTAVLQKAVDPRRPDYLFLQVGPEGPRMLPCRPAGEPRRAGGEPEWSYKEEGDTLHVAPSLLATDTGFHTAYDWTCKFQECPPSDSQYDFFYDLNPEWKAQA